MFINNTSRKFKEQTESKNNNQKSEKDFFLYFGNSSRQFAKRLRVLVKRKSKIDICVCYTSFKTGFYFRLKCSIPLSLMSNVAYKFNCLRDVDLSYIVMTTYHFKRQS